MLRYSSDLLCVSALDYMRSNVMLSMVFMALMVVRFSLDYHMIEEKDWPKFYASSMSTPYEHMDTTATMLGHNASYHNHDLGSQ
jgi:hypothetical protein